jgi:hypothetical protein
MNNNNSNISYRKSSPQQGTQELLEPRLYNLLFTGKISMKEYLNALNSTNDSSKKEA